MIDTKALREKVLDLAIRGKLVPQDPSDEPASVLLKKIREQKKQMVKEGKLKAKDIKNDTIIFKGDDNLHYEQFADGTVKCIENEIPFKLPAGWVWERLGHISTIARGGSPRPIKAFLTNDAKGVNWIKIGDTEKDGKYIFSTKERIKPESVSKSRFVKSGDFLLTNSMSFGRPYILKTEGCIHDGWLVIGDIELIFDQDYLYYALSAKYMYQAMAIMAGGSTVDNLNSDLVKSLMFPIPPINEQKYIARKVSDLLELVESIKSNEETIVGEISLIKSKILDLAIQGKLVPQDPNDEPASVLLDRIRAEKEELIKAGKIKRDKKESVIFKGDDNSYYRLTSDNKRNVIDIPFDIPENWEWCNLSMIGSTNIGLTYKPADIVADGTMVLRSSNIINGKIDLSDLVRVNSTIRENQYIQENDILICARNGSKALVGKCAIFENVNEKASFGAFMAVYRSRCFRYVYYFLNSEFFKNTFSNDDSKQINQLTQDMIKNTAIPLPPLAEQKRIVKAIETIFAKLDEISNAIV